MQEALVVVERDRIRLAVELDALGALQADAPELLLQAEERPRLDAGAVGRDRRHARAHHGDSIAHEADAHPEIPLRAERALDHGHAVDRAQDDVAEGWPIDLRALLVEVAQRDPPVLAHRTLEQALAPPAAAEQMVIAELVLPVAEARGLHELEVQQARVVPDALRQRRVVLHAPQGLAASQERVERDESLDRGGGPLDAGLEVRTREIGRAHV